MPGRPSEPSGDFAAFAVRWLLSGAFAGRAAFRHPGAMTAAIMTGRRRPRDLPNRRIVVAGLKAGRTPDPENGRIAKLRPRHDAHLTLPVILPMLPDHCPMVSGTEHAWIIAALVFLMGMRMRHHFDPMHARTGAPYRTRAGTALAFVAITWLGAAPMWRADTPRPPHDDGHPPRAAS